MLSLLTLTQCFNKLTIPNNLINVWHAENQSKTDKNCDIALETLGVSQCVVAGNQWNNWKQWFYAIIILILMILRNFWMRICGLEKKNLRVYHNLLVFWKTYMILSPWKKDLCKLLFGTVPPFVSVVLASEAHQILLGNDETKNKDIY